jgi:hypothetical protein
MICKICKEQIESWTDSNGNPVPPDVDKRTAHLTCEFAREAAERERVNVLVFIRAHPTESPTNLANAIQRGDHDIAVMKVHL